MEAPGGSTGPNNRALGTYGVVTCVLRVRVTANFNARSSKRTTTIHPSSSEPLVDLHRSVQPVYHGFFCACRAFLLLLAIPKHGNQGELQSMARKSESWSNDLDIICTFGLLQGCSEDSYKVTRVSSGVCWCII